MCLLIARRSGAQTSRPASAPATQGETEEQWLESIRPAFKLGQIPKLSLLPRAPLSPERAKQIKDLIARLATIDGEDYGLSEFVEGEAFLPLPDVEKPDITVIDGHSRKVSGELKSLIEAGPDAIPFLLESLADRTPTKWVVKPGRWSAMAAVDWLEGNPVNEREMKLLAPLEKPAHIEATIDSYTVKVGDVCLVALGQIVGRPYRIARFSHNERVLTYVVSPSDHLRIREQMCALWSGQPDPARTLFDSLLLDYATEGVFHGRSLDSWYPGSEYTRRAAMRLLYYFPAESDALIAQRVAQMDVRSREPQDERTPTTEESDQWMFREVANGTCTAKFIRAISWSDAPLTRAAVRKVFAKTDDTDILLAALPAEEDKTLIQSRLESFLNALPTGSDTHYGYGYRLLAALGNRVGKDSLPDFDRYLENASPDRCFSVANALKEIEADWTLPLFRRLLTDSRPIPGWNYGITREPGGERAPIRVCDQAALSLHARYPEFKFEQLGTHADLDNQIREILPALDARINESAK